MSDYLMIESRDPFECPGVLQQWQLARDLAGRGHRVTLVLVQNGVLAARAGARTATLAQEGPGNRVEVLVDDFSLAERGIASADLRAGVRPIDIDALTDLLLEDGCRPVWT